ncbi:Wzz/FepE/Etk N-terminal domain-containing protein [Sphingomonas sp. Leaf343]|uniref:Wzz/FepE/Etk N-terminal domain-containing protein n=1 Tax=Sphingomonas sp. Leaf343 TaxID=1736345 RepID=UPI0006F30C3B|nr:Wzz/FepE/Etk N-terminal domain-containing protein [Sphingomonas sp. Leaf343]
MQFVLVLKARWRLIAAIIVGGIVLSLLWVALVPRTYSATAQVLVNVRQSSSVSVDGDPTVTAQLQPDYLSTQVDVIRSNRVGVAAVKRLKMLDDADSMQAYRESGSTAEPEIFFAQQLSGGLKVVPSSSSRVISIIYSSRNPQLAAAVANAYADAYRDISVDLQREPERQATAWYDRSVADLGNRLTQAQATLSRRRAELGLTATNEAGGDADDARLLALAQQLAGAQGAQSVQNARAAGGALPDALSSPVIQSLQTDIARAEAQRRQLSTFAGPNNVDYRQLTNQLATLRSELAKQRAIVAQAAAASSAQSNAASQQLRGAVDAQRSRVIASQRSRGEITALEQNVTNLKTTYEQLVAKQAQSTLLGASNQSNILLLSPATKPTAPAGLPDALKIIVVALLATIIGIVAALALEFLDQRLRTPEDAEIWLGIPNLGGVRGIEAPRQRLLGHVPTHYLPKPSQEGVA